MMPHTQRPTSDFLQYDNTATPPVTNIVLSVFREVWRDFYAWEHIHCEQAIASLRNRGFHMGKSLRYAEYRSFKVMTPLEEDMAEATTSDETSDDDEETFTVHTFPNGHAMVEHLVCAIHDVPTIKRHVPYEACPPISSNTFQGDEPHDMPFVPFADDWSFDEQQYMSRYKRFAWQGSTKDPDSSTITVEATRRLRFMHHIPISQVEETGVLPHAQQSSLTAEDAIWPNTHSDSLDWPGSSHTLFRHLFNAPVPAQGDLRHRLQDYLTLFCQRLSCLRALCPTHCHSQHAVNFAQKFPLSCPNADIETASTPCGHECYLIASSASRVTSSSVADRDNLRVILQIAPASQPCELSVICRKPCWEIATMSENIRIDRIGPNNNHALAHTMSLGDFADDNHAKFTPNDPCAHQGPCDAQCPCSMNDAHCTRECNCAANCPRRWPGCHCNRRKNGRPRACDTNSCPCRAAKRECDPELCSSCEIEYTHATYCRNSQIQKNKHKNLEVRHSNFGLGVFLKQPAREGDLIGEYTGELISEQTFDTRGQLSNFRKRSYVYQLNSTLSIDSTYAGNPTRFINHAPDKKANCAVSVILVHGSHRIGVYAKKPLAKGTELLLDYGPEFHF